MRPEGRNRQEKTWREAVVASLLVSVRHKNEEIYKQRGVVAQSFPEIGIKEGNTQKSVQGEEFLESILSSQFVNERISLFNDRIHLNCVLF